MGLKLVRQADHNATWLCWLVVLRLRCSGAVLHLLPPPPPDGALTGAYPEMSGLQHGLGWGCVSPAGRVWTWASLSTSSSLASPDQTQEQGQRPWSGPTGRLELLGAAKPSSSS